MADVAAMDIVIGANVQAALAGLEHLSDELANLAKGGVTSIAQLDRAIATLRATIAKSTSVAEITKLNSALKGLEAEAARIKNIGTAAQKTGKDFTGLSRVIQDLPFGFMGIQNNITQLLPAAGALGLAVSAITTAITFMSVGFGAWTRGMGGTSEAAKAAAKAMEDFKKSLDEARTSGMSTGIQLQAFVDIAKDSKLPLSQRNEALDEANKLMGIHGEKLTLANVGTQAMTEQVEKLTTALINQAIAAKMADRIADLTIQQTENIKKQGEALKTFNRLNERAKGGGDAGFAVAWQRGKNALDDAEESVNLTGQSITELSGTMKDANKISTELFGEMGTHAKDTKKHIRDAADVMPELEKNLNNLRKTQQVLSGDIRAEMTSAIEGAVKELIKFGVAVDDPRITDLSHRLHLISQSYFDINAAVEKASQSLTKLNKQISPDAMGKTAGSLVIDATMHVPPAEKKSFFDDIENMMMAAKELQGIFEGIFTSILETGKISIESLFKSIEQLIVKLAAAAVAAAILNALLPAGIAKDAGNFKGIFGMLSGIKGLAHAATGGIVTGPQVLLAGEKGPEAIIPLDRLNEFMQAGPQVVVMETRISGNDLFLIQSRTNQRRGRTY